MFHQQSWLARMEEYRPPLQLCFSSWNTPQPHCREVVWWAHARLMDQKQLQGSQRFPLAALHCQPAALRPLAQAQSTATAVPNTTSCHTWFSHGACTKYPIHYVHSIPGGDWNKKLFWQKSLGNETRERWGKRRKTEIKTRKKHSTRWMECIQNY